MRKRPVVAYPVIFKYFTADSGPFISVTSPNLPGLVVGANNARAALHDTQAGIAQLLSCPPYPEVVDATTWALQPNEEVVFVSVDLDRWHAGMLSAGTHE
ncbi:hypothetical protein [Lacticaseibacillus thailandensis]|nr:hypothetical protein [Lacticaseibacillus thailandensis]